MDALHYTAVESPLGPVLVAGDDAGLRHIAFQHGTRAVEPPAAWVRDDAGACAPVAEAARQLRAYFAGVLRAFDLLLAARGTDFQQRVWSELRRIPYGETVSYGQLAERMGRPTASRAVGAANGRNPLPIVVPCHRVIGSTGALTGFGGGLPLKEGLLALERSHTPGWPVQAALL